MSTAQPLPTPEKQTPKQKPKKKGRYSIRLGMVEIAALIMGLLYMIPFYYVLSNSFKSRGDIFTNTSGLPKEWMASNYVDAWEAMNFGRVFLNSVIITVGANAIIVIFCSMAAWKLVRTKTRLSTIIFFLFVAAMIIPFQSIMIPLSKLSGQLGLQNSYWGLILMYLGFGSG
ncbi:MAG: carbohydrate ABC transporter permease, partial [Exiguobacterium oxidotolerans]